MRLAFLILAHNNPKHLNRLICTLNHTQCGFYIHIDKKSNLNEFDIPVADNIKIIKERENVNWGGFSTVKATLKLLKESFKNNYDYYALLSGSDYPVKKSKKILNFLTKNNGKEFINISRMPANNKSFNRFKYYLEYDTESKFITNIYRRYFNKISYKFFPIRKLPDQYKYFIPYGGSSWWCLSKKAVNYILNFTLQNKDFMSFYSKTLSSDELFFQTILGNSNFKKNITTSLTYADWNQGGPHPAVISEKHFNILYKGKQTTSYGNADFFFARKFSDSSETIINKLVKFLLIKKLNNT